MSAETKLAPIADDEWTGKLAAMRGGFAGRLNVYKVIAHNPDLLAGWESYRNHVVTSSTLPARTMELLILRAAHRWQVNYEWVHHVERGKAVGLSDDDVAAVQGGPEDPHWAQAEAAVLASVDELIDLGRISQPLLDRLGAHFSGAQILDMIATLGMYRTLAYVISTFDVPLEPERARAE